MIRKPDLIGFFYILDYSLIINISYDTTVLTINLDFLRILYENDYSDKRYYSYCVLFL